MHSSVDLIATIAITQFFPEYEGAKVTQDQFLMIQAIWGSQWHVEALYSNRAAAFWPQEMKTELCLLKPWTEPEDPCCSIDVCNIMQYHMSHWVPLVITGIHILEKHGHVGSTQFVASQRVLWGNSPGNGKSAFFTGNPAENMLLLWWIFHYQGPPETLPVLGDQSYGISLTDSLLSRLCHLCRWSAVCTLELLAVKPAGEHE